jgi:NAD(P)-dependent dehydrogenase (short-subunit alcohol dehydrogenase family)
MASVAGKRGMPQRTAYSASKMAVIGFTRSLAVEVGNCQIRVNALCPGTILGKRQDLVNQGIVKYTGKSLETVLAEKTEASPLKIMIAPEYVAGLVAFLCSTDAAMMTGQDINITAGVVMY